MVLSGRMNPSVRLMPELAGGSAAWALVIVACAVLSAFTGEPAGTATSSGHGALTARPAIAAATPARIGSGSLRAAATAPAASAVRREPAAGSGAGGPVGSTPTAPEPATEQPPTPVSPPEGVPGQPEAPGPVTTAVDDVSQATGVPVDEAAGGVAGQVDEAIDQVVPGPGHSALVPGADGENPIR